ncbi:U1 small nuclear ribonucleoprotein 70 kDa-like isoform X1 [Panonychus citri]|uniref:U1 small nuclear ribonucleoprotein 70 kDa-like isoform X1 n=1 Tax=Panonychus citri TaxID=50023 RepID=UPI0023078BD0|nr:U1 small nuclear ribonucleoprotein 70 kDa-like isoform X1 [Panonychus citri]
MTQYLPPNLLALFAPRDPIPYLPPVDKLPFQKKTTGYTGVAKYVSYFEDPKDTPPPKRIESREEHLERKRREKAEQVIYRLEQRIASWDPQNNATSTTDPYKTLFIARINYDTSESKLRREFEAYGTIKKVIIVHDKISGKHRGYAFIEYEHERDMHAAYKYADGKKIDGRRVLVDVERGRTVKGWLPRKLGGGLGGTRRGGPDQNAKHSGREDNRYDDAEREKFERMNLSRDRERDRGDRGERGERGEREKEVIEIVVIVVNALNVLNELNVVTEEIEIVEEDEVEVEMRSEIESEESEVEVLEIKNEQNVVKESDVELMDQKAPPKSQHSNRSQTPKQRIKMFKLFFTSIFKKISPVKFHPKG